MSMSKAARTINATAFSYITSWALLTAAELRVFDHLPARSQDLSAISPDPDLVDTLDVHPVTPFATIGGFYLSIGISIC